MNTRYITAGFLGVVMLVSGLLLFKKVQPVVAVMQEAKVREKSKGPANAPIQIVEYSDFQCPACQKAEPVITKLMEEYPGKIHFVFRHFPLSGHRWAGLAHQAAQCAYKEGKFWEYHDRLYQEQAQWSVMANPSEAFLRYAQEYGLTLDAFALCLTNEEVRAQVLEDRKRGEELQVRSTPYFFLNGERVVGSVELAIKGPEMIRKALGLPPLPVVPVPFTAAVVVPPSDAPANPASSSTQEQPAAGSTPPAA